MESYMDDIERSIVDQTTIEGELLFRDGKGEHLAVEFGKYYVGFRPEESYEWCELDDVCVRSLYNKLGAWLAWRNR